MIDFLNDLTIYSMKTISMPTIMACVVAKCQKKWTIYIVLVLWSLLLK